MQKSKIRLYVDSCITNNVPISLNDYQRHYLKNVMRTKECKIFNGLDGEWLAKAENNRLFPIEQIQIQKEEPSKIKLCFAIIKKPAIYITVKQATEFGISYIQPVYTEFTAAKDFNLQKLVMHAIEASEQSNRLSIPTIKAPIKTKDVLETYNNILIFSNKRATHGLESINKMNEITLFVGPEGGFSNNEIDLFLQKKITIINLGSNILRAETASIVAISSVHLLTNKIIKY